MTSIASRRSVDGSHSALRDDGEENALDGSWKSPSKLSNRATFGKHPWLTRDASRYSAPPRTLLAAPKSFSSRSSAAAAAMTPNAFLLSFASSIAFSRIVPTYILSKSSLLSDAPFTLRTPRSMSASCIVAKSRGCKRVAASTCDAIGHLPPPSSSSRGHRLATSSNPRSSSRACVSARMVFIARSSAHATRKRNRSRSPVESAALAPTASPRHLTRVCAFGAIASLASSAPNASSAAR
eukprot:29839-Pelagococcus_subviridis.AAC.4